ncbi:MAG: ABC transporter permease [Candidatus Cloacimonetes bacterium]|nr:ABC transporter permease [Candidatus Cloacimonadota bacterium]
MAISLRESVHIGLADILTRKVRTAVTIIGIILGVTSIMVVLAIVKGMNEFSIRWMEERGGLNKIEVSPDWQLDYREWSKAKFTFSEINRIKSLLPEAKAFSPVGVSWSMVVQKGDILFSTNVKGVYPDMTIVDEWNAARGRFVSYFDINNFNNVIVLGSTAVKELFGDKDPIGEYVTINNQNLHVIGIMQEKYLKMQGGFGDDNALEYMNKQAFIPLTTMTRKLNVNQDINRLEIKADSPEDAVLLRKKVQNIVLNLKQGNKYFEVSSAKEEMDEMKQNSKMFMTIFILIAVISLFVGGIVIMNIMLASIQERTREIGVRLAIGARRLDIFIQFMVQTVLITTIGGIIGILTGYGILSIVGRFLVMKLTASLSMIYGALIVSVGVGLLFGIAPAVKASNLDPVIALRNE